ncbi:DNA-directed RNA polymerase I subunit RPA49-like [Salarias fasciatus]|uniref:DNA-directed RNA polymerase I subunit RPA49-like n=1 Tax=Salarias fasciatus TaxID=181472 RepID=A0A672J093_SALFA|nr:DNA-directed RNA polymerase I subunit RPA49-like [Salarias fasciatus]XP_029948971.1 DNA-directed RNA polymerase I subunit RPA49-like [Salarias fasciatus]
MAASCSLVCCEEERESDQAVIVRFSNGNVKNEDKLDFTMYKNTDENNPRKKSRRILVAESDRLSYVGHNFGVGSLKCNSLCKYYVGVLNKETMQMEVHSAQLFNMQPVIPGETTESAKSQDAPQSYRDKVDSLIEAFGTTKQKRALSSRRLNQVGSDTLHHAVTKAANSVIDKKGLEALQQEVAETESQNDLSIHLPPCDANADARENVYPFDQLLSPVEFDALEQAGSKLAALTPEELQTMRSDGRCLSVLKHLDNMPTAGELREKTARCAFYLSLLLKLSRQKSVTRKFGQEDNCPRIIQNKLMRNFTVETFNNGRVQNIVSSSMRAKLAAYCLALLLHMGHMTADLTLLHRDLGITEARITEVAKAMGLTLIKPPRAKDEDATLRDDRKQATLVLPLVKYEQFTERRKRKKMH